MKPISNPRINQKVLTKTGYKVYKHPKDKWDKWDRWYNRKCGWCSNLLIRRENKKMVFCDHNCKRKYHMQNKDSVGFNILNQSNNTLFYYLIGLICADGHIAYPNSSPSQRGYQCSIELHKKDNYLLKNIKQTFGGKFTLVACKKWHNSMWSIHNKEFVLYLKDVVGLTHNKSFNLNVTYWFNLLTEENKQSFIRGVFDGDGSVYCSKSKGAYICSCSIKFIEMIHNYFISKNMKCHLYSPQDIHDTYKTMFHCKYALQLYNLMYNNYENLFLVRKLAKFKQIEEYYKEKL